MIYIFFNFLSSMKIIMVLGIISIISVWFHTSHTRDSERGHVAPRNMCKRRHIFFNSYQERQDLDSFREIS